MDNTSCQRYGRKVYVPLAPDVLDALRAQAADEQRPPVGQAAVLITAGLKAAGYLSRDWRPRRSTADESRP